MKFLCIEYRTVRELTCFAVFLHIISLISLNYFKYPTKICLCSQANEQIEQIGRWLQASVLFRSAVSEQRTPTPTWNQTFYRKLSCKKEGNSLSVLHRISLNYCNVQRLNSTTFDLFVLNYAPLQRRARLKQLHKLLDLYKILNWIYVQWLPLHFITKQR